MEEGLKSERRNVGEGYEEKMVVSRCAALLLGELMLFMRWRGEKKGRRGIKDGEQHIPICAAADRQGSSSRHVLPPRESATSLTPRGEHRSCRAARIVRCEYGMSTMVTRSIWSSS